MLTRGRYRAAGAAKKYTNFKVKKLRYTSAKVQKCISTGLISDNGSNQWMVRVVESKKVQQQYTNCKVQKTKVHKCKSTRMYKYRFDLR